MPRSQTLNICSNREVCEGQEQKTDQAIFFSIRTAKHSTSWSPRLPYKLTQLLCSLCILKVQLSDQTLCLQAICTSSWCKNSFAPLIMTRKTWVQSQWEQVIPEGCKTWNVGDKALSYAGFSIPLLSFLLLLPGTWVLMSWESLGSIVSTKHTAEIIQPEALLISTNFSNEVPTVTHKISLEKLDL
jgi:hypothetical protein